MRETPWSGWLSRHGKKLQAAAAVLIVAVFALDYLGYLRLPFSFPWNSGSTTGPNKLLVVKDTVTEEESVAVAGYGLYVYLLPQPEISADALKEVTAYFQCLKDAGGTGSKSLAVFILPAKPKSDPQSLVVDTQLAKRLMETVSAEPEIDRAELYVVVTNQPLTPDVVSPPSFVITLGRIAPQFIGTWLSRLQELVEDKRIEKPDDLVLQIRSVLAILGSVGKLIGIEPANAAAFECR